MRIFILFLALASSLHGYRPVPDPYLASELARAQGERRHVEGRIWVLDERREKSVPFASFGRVGGEIYLAPKLGRAEAHGTLRVDMGSWQSSFGTLDRRIRRDLLQLSRHPYATLKIYDIQGVSREVSETERYSLGRLIGELELVGQSHTIDLPIRIHRFSDGALGIEPTTYLHLTADQLGFGNQARALIASSDLLSSDQVRCLFRLEVSTR